MERVTGMRPLTLSASLPASALLFALAAAAAFAAPLEFNRDIRPILSENCFQCHGPDANKRRAELRLDVRDEAVAARAFVPGKPDESDAIHRVFSADEDEVMPPPESRRVLSSEQLALLRRWVAEGASYQQHWAYVPPVKAAVPASRVWPDSTNPIDAFIGATLERNRLTPAPAADRRTLLRRLSLDLAGLPPRPEEVAAFLRDSASAAYERQVDRLLASPHFGERMAIHWLDLVRFADSIGFHNDVGIRTWPYRDYVIGAFNRNLPFDQFVREQLAGDLLPGSTVNQRVGSGFNRLHRISGEGGIQDKEYFAKYAADRVRTTATVFMGATMACAECHDHKFDPYTLKDFYRFAAIFADLKEKGAYNLSGGFTRENLTEEPIFSAAGQEARLKELEAEITRTSAALKAVGDQSLAAERAVWEEATLAADRAGTLAWRVQRARAVSSPHGTTLTIDSADDSIIPSGPNPANDTYVVTIPAGLPSVTAVRLEVIQDPRFPADEVARAGSGFFISEIEIEGRGGGDTVPRRLRIAASRAGSTTEPGAPAEAAIDGDPATAVSFLRKRGGGIALLLAEPWTAGPASELTIRIRHSDLHPYQNLGRFRLSVHGLPTPDAHTDSVPDNVIQALRVARAARKPAQEKEIAAYFRQVAPSLLPLRQALIAAANARDYLLASLPSMPVSRSVEPRPIRVLPRGNWMDESGEIVAPGVPAFLRQITPADGRRVSRLDLAEWLVAGDNPLTARTFVNRMWRLFFGAGLTRTLEDLGSQGEWPSHPELLDWLAVDFRENGWDVKRLVRMIVTSRAYQQSSRPEPSALEVDPVNRLLAHQNRFRLEAELVRDMALSAGGILVDQLGGPSAKPYQPAGYYAALNFPRREYAPDTGDGLWRRGVYTHWQRTFLLPSFVAFDAPSRDECTANRSVSNTPLQALVLLNDPSFVEAARGLAERMMRTPGVDFAGRVAVAFERALARPPTAEEASVLQSLWTAQHRRYLADEPAALALLSTGARPVAPELPPAELAAWTAVARAILNLHETITRS
jgi:mono/diheme cytochrome c family protein